MTSFTEDSLIEQPAIRLLGELGWQTLNCYQEVFGHDGTLGRETPNDVLLLRRLWPALRRLNPDLPGQALQAALDELGRSRPAASLAEANRQVYLLLKEGVPVLYRGEHELELAARVRVIDWEHPESNDFFLASQLWVSGEVYKRRCDLVGFVNGIPLLFIELKAAHKALKTAFSSNLRDYKATIPQLFWYNGFILLSNGSQSRIGSLTSEWEHFGEWKKINAEGEEGLISLETILRGTCPPERLLDLIENFVLYEEARGGLRKIIARNHQYLGVNNAVQAVQRLRQTEGKLGVFWHTQGSGKSYSMVFFSQKVLRKLPGNWTFLVVTDRQDLDDQIYKNFADCGVVKESEQQVRADSGQHLRQLLREDHRFLFSLIQKFHIEGGQTYPCLSERGDIIVMTDEAHRSQYDVLALNMRNALPNAAFLAFTGTPLMAGEERTRAVFGDYVSIYNFKQSVDDGATVPLYYENRIPELQITNPELNEQMADLLDEALLDEKEEARLEREFRREYHLITRDERLEKVAADIVQHFLGRGYQGKAMVISVDKATAVRMYDKVRKHWIQRLTLLEAEREQDHSAEDWQQMQDEIAYLRETDMAVVVSQGQNEVEDMRAKGLEILPHRTRMLREDLATKFKDPKDPFRLVFVCAMWMTGFDAPSCSTIYLDKPMRNHTLMQTIARANRVFGEKVNGLIVDYIGIFRELQKALAVYGSGAEGELGEGELPVQDKQALVQRLEQEISAARALLAENGVDLDAIHAADDWARVRLLEDAVNALVKTDELKKAYLTQARLVDLLFHAILPDPAANRFGPDRKAVVVLAEAVRANSDPVDITDIMEQVDALLDESVAPKDGGYVIHGPHGSAGIAEPQAPRHWVDLSQIDFDLLRKSFEKSRKHIEAEKLRGAINAKLRQLVRLNHARMNYYEEFQRMVEEYNAGALNIDAFFAQLVNFAQRLNAEEQRGVAEALTEEQLAVFDLLIRPGLKMSKQEVAAVKAIACELLDTLRAECLVLDWRRHQKTRAQVRLVVEKMLDRLPEVYDPQVYTQACDQVYQHIYDSYFGAGKSIYLPLAA